MAHVDNVFRDLFDEYKASYEASIHLEEINENDQERDDLSCGASSTLSKKLDFMEEFYKFSEEEDMSHSKSELDVYLEEKLHPSKNTNDEFNVLQWWKHSSSKFPILSRMARDILAIPVSSVASESAFSTGGRVLSPFRSSLLPSTIEALICTQDWI